MHPAPMRKRHIPYSFFDVAEFLQTRMQNARDERAARRDAKSRYSIGFFDRGRAIGERRPRCGVLARSSMPTTLPDGHKARAQNRPPSLASPRSLGMRKKPINKGFSNLAKTHRASCILQRVFAKNRTHRKSLTSQRFSRGSDMHAPCAMHAMLRDYRNAHRVRLVGW
jgi:hypothetical protein